MADIEVQSAELKDGVLTVSGSGFTKTTTTLYVDGASVPFTINDASGDIEAEVDSASQVYAEKGGIQSTTVDVTQATASGAADAGTAEPGSTQPYPGYPDADPQTTTADRSETEAGSVSYAPTASELNSGPEPSHTADTDASTESGGQEPYKTAEPNFTPGDITKDDSQTTSDVSEEDLALAGNAGAEAKNAQAANAPNRTPLEQGEHLPGTDFRTRVENTAAGDLNMDPRQPYPTGNPPDPKDEFRRIYGHEPIDQASSPAAAEQAAQLDADPKT